MRATKELRFTARAYFLYQIHAVKQATLQICQGKNIAADVCPENIFQGSNEKLFYGDIAFVRLNFIFLRLNQ